MTDDEHNTAPTTVKEVGIHIGYIRDDIAELKQIVKDIKDESVGRIEFEANKLQVVDKFVQVEADIKELDRKVTKRPWTLGTSIAIFSSIITAVVLYVVQDLINGGK